MKNKRDIAVEKIIIDLNKAIYTNKNLKLAWEPEKVHKKIEALEEQLYSTCVPTA